MFSVLKFITKFILDKGTTSVQNSRPTLPTAERIEP